MSTIPARTKLVPTQFAKDLVRTTAALAALAVIGIVGASLCYGGVLSLYIIGTALTGG